MDSNIAGTAISGSDFDALRDFIESKADLKTPSTVIWSQEVDREDAIGS
jgi:hypothetical protein